MKRYIFFMFLLLSAMVACQDDDDPVVPAQSKNLYRVREISGINERWGEFRLKCGYTNERLDSIVRYDAQGKIQNRLVTSYSGSIARFYWYDYVVSVSPDSVAKLEPDSIPRVLQLAASWYFQLKDGLIREEQRNTYGPKTLSKDAEFDYTYELQSEAKYLFEYDEAGRLAVMRRMNLLDIEEHPLKYEFLYENDRQAEFIEHFYRTDAWKPVRKVANEWQGGQLKAVLEYVMDQDWVLQEKRDFVYSGGFPSQLLSETGNVSYSFDAAGNLTGYRCGNISLQMKYEAGHGNFSWIQWPECLLTVEPGVK